VDAGDIGARNGESGFLSLAVGVAAEPERIAEAGALHQLRVDVEFGAIRETHPEERGGAGRVLELLAAGEAVLTLVRRAECRIALADVRQLTVRIPVGRRDRPRLCRNGPGRILIHRAPFAVQAGSQGLQIESRLVTCPRWEVGGDAAEPVIEIFETRA